MPTEIETFSVQVAMQPVDDERYTRAKHPFSPTTFQDLEEVMIRYDTRCYFNVRSKADMSQLNLPHGIDN